MAYKASFRQSPNYSKGRPAGDPNVIVIHYWDRPERKPSFAGVVNWLMNPKSQASAHYVAEAGRVTQLVHEYDRAWHAGPLGNPRGIGIECNPRMSRGDLETVAELIANIRKRRGNLPLQPHNHYMSTSCPGSWEGKLAWLSKRADEINAGSKPAPSKPASPALAVDGWFGPASTKRLQQVLGTKTTGQIGGQRAINKRFHPAMTSLFYKKEGNSMVIRALQQKLGVNNRGGVGQFGPKTIRAWQRKLGVTADGFFGPASASAAQRALNNGKAY